MTRPAGRVRIVVDRLVLDGLVLDDLGQAAVRDVDALVAGLTAELHRLVADRPTPGPAGPRHTAVPDVRAPDIAVTGRAPAREVGRRIGGAVDAAIGGAW